MNDKCKICNSGSVLLFNATVLHKYDVKYYQCSNCNFIQTETPYWLDESYKSAIAAVDTGIVTRNLIDCSIISKLIRLFFNTKGKFLDYGGGYGLFVRLMRDRGFNFYRYDKYSENLFARHFDLADTDGENDFELITSFEVFEHLSSPLAEISEMMKNGKSLVFSTEIIPKIKIQTVHDWWYFSPDAGQHISFYSFKSLSLIAKQLGCNLYSNGKNLHLFTHKKFMFDPLKAVYLFTMAFDKVCKRNFFNKKSLINSDYIFAKSKLKSS
jgi:2-polyprenyl-3-methyl-5-hydroxy-6-metoxy-1,4-benzoquinol methylase